MYATPRVPAPEDMGDFVEIRYFRFGSASISAAVLFGLIESAGSSHFSAFRKPFLNLCASKELKHLLKQAISSPPDTLIQAWNYNQELYIRLRKGLGDLALLDDEAFPIQLAYDVRCTLKVDGVGEEMKDSEAAPVLEIRHLKGEVVIGYRGYSRESVVVTPCGHAHLKYALFKAFRECSKGAPMDLQESSQSLHIPCSNGCACNLASAVFSIGEIDSGKYEIGQCRKAYFSIQNGTEGEGEERCEHIMQSDQFYECKHSSCWGCVVRWVVVSGQMKSECCNKPIKPEYRKEICEYIQEMKGITVNLTILCAKCSTELPDSNYFISKQMLHRCLLCDNCLKSSINQAKYQNICPICEAQYTARDISAIFKGCEDIDDPLRPLGSSYNGSDRFRNELMRCCLCRNSLSKGEFRAGFRLKDSCLVCDNCRFMDKSSCPQCHKGYSYEDQMVINALQISSEQSSLRPIPSTKKCTCEQIITKEGYHCPNMCYCVMCLLKNYVTNKQWKCPRCNADIAGEPPGNVQCSGCYRALNPISLAFQNNVFALCSRGCILCCYCIRLPTAETGGRCPICNETIASLNWREAEACQSAFPCAGVCASSEPPDAVLECGHFVHVQCAGSFYNCRICWKEYRPREYSVTLASYSQ